jgi:hypothetical protein
MKIFNFFINLLLLLIQHHIINLLYSLIQFYITYYPYVILNLISLMMVTLIIQMYHLYYLCLLNKNILFFNHIQYNNDFYLHNLLIILIHYLDFYQYLNLFHQLLFFNYHLYILILLY